MPTDRPVVEAAKTTVSLVVLAPVVLIAVLIGLAVFAWVLNNIVTIALGLLGLIAVAWFLNPPKKQPTDPEQKNPAERKEPCP